MSANFKRVKIAKIKIAQQQLNMADEDYRALLVRATGKNSSTTLSDEQLNMVLREMERLGFKPSKRRAGGHRLTLKLILRPWSVR